MENGEKTFDLSILIKALRRFWLWIVIATVLMAVLAGAATVVYAKIKPSYRAETQYLVVSGASTSSSDYNANRLARERVADVSNVIKAKRTMQSVLEDAKMDATNLEAVCKMISVSVANDTSVLTVTVRGEDSAYVKELTMALELHLPLYIKDFFEDGTRLNVVDNAFLTSDEEPQPEESHLLRNVAIATLIALLVSGLIAILVQINDRTVYNADTLKAAFAETPLLGTIPVWESGAHVGSGKKVDPNGESHDYNGKLLVAQSPFYIAEAYRSLRTNLCYAVPAHKAGVVFGVTSARNGEGKTMTAANLAVSFAGLSKRVLLVEADMRMPTLGKIFGYTAESGLADLLAGIETDYTRCLVKAKDTEGLDILPVGALPPNPQELLASDTMKALIETLRGAYDVILLDLPPVGIVSDAGVIAGLVDRYIMVIRANFSDTAAIEAMLGEMDKTSMHSAGFVLTDVPKRRSSYYYERKKTAESV